MKKTRRRLGIVAVAVLLVCLSVSLGTWATRRQGETGSVSWSPLFESREKRALVPLKTVEADGTAQHNASDLRLWDLGLRNDGL